MIGSLQRTRHFESVKLTDAHSLSCTIAHGGVGVLQRWPRHDRQLRGEAEATETHERPPPELARAPEEAPEPGILGAGHALRARRIREDPEAEGTDGVAAAVLSRGGVPPGATAKNWEDNLPQEKAGNEVLKKAGSVSIHTSAIHRDSL
jgi:hypothetical protein